MFPTPLSQHDTVSAAGALAAAPVALRDPKHRKDKKEKRGNGE